MRAAVGLAHHGNNCDSASSSYRLSLKDGCKLRLVTFRKGSDDVDKLGNGLDFVFGGDAIFKFREVDLLAPIEARHEDVNDLSNGLDRERCLIFALRRCRS